ncbi:BMP family lipoprotein [Limoniibacter endophyticus]|uniref:BMP family ABC transporter substrate-binding protein n=1 Tax=Limoniibacter endophyticus TaxID=1565040 RepID=A0A8J3DK79_9HYPH|nr:BMP family ABC transporter substrate-binding protein [Limoniibacter endophyticus]GHC80429.1 BMP family ABC transporter substrate-binding protein [Limoniibacter endophyticus]
MKRLLTGLFAATMLTMPALAQDDYQPAVIYDLGGKFDKSFNEAAYNGAQKFADETGVEFRDFELQNDSQREQALRRFADDENNPIVMAGFAWASVLEKVAPDYPDTHFVVIDTVVEQPNVGSIVFKEAEGSYIVGVLAAMASKSKTVGFIGGMDVPLIRKFGCGFVGGAKAGGATKVLYTMTGDTPSAWNDPTKGGEIARSQFDQGSDVVYHAAGGTGIGVLQAAADAGKLGIGVDSNQNGLHPGKVLTSMVKGVDTAVYDALKTGQAGEFKTGVTNLGLKEGGVSYALDENNAALITDEMKVKAEEIQAQIVSGELVVHDYMTDNKCPYQD